MAETPRRMPTPLLSWYRRTELNAQAERVVARAVLASADVEAPRHRNSYLPGDSAALRGLPAVCVRGGFGGAIRGTQPEREAMCRERDSARGLRYARHHSIPPFGAAVAHRSEERARSPQWFKQGRLP